MAKQFQKLSRSKVKTFKIKNRKGYAAICFDNLTEGPNANEAVRRMSKALKRQGYALAV